MAGALPTTGPGKDVLYVTETMKAAGTSASTVDRAVNPGTRFFSARLKLAPGAKSGVVFDGAALGSKWKAAIIDRLGDDTVNQGHFSVGRFDVI